MPMVLLLTTLMLATVLSAGGAAQRLPGSALKKVPVKVVALGDSLTSGHRLAKSDSYPALLEKRLKAIGFSADVENHGVNGDTTAGGVRRLDAALAEDPQILIVAFGANDGLRGVPVAQVRANLEKMIQRAQSRGVKVLLVGMDALPIYGWQYTIDFHNLFPELAAKYHVPLVPFMLDGVLGNPDLMSPDGVHPNAAGAKVIADNIWSALKPLAESIVAPAE
jgi:acyl-CoA thioesterase I